LKIDYCSQNWPMRSKRLFLKSLCDRSHQHVHKTDMCPNRAVFVFRSMFCSCSRRHEEERRPENLFLLMRSWPGTGVVEWHSISYGGSWLKLSASFRPCWICLQLLFWRKKSDAGTNIALAPHCYVIFSSSSLIYLPSSWLVSEFYSKMYTLLSCLAALVVLGLLYEVPRSHHIR
jgi:hypothetical protein